MRRARIPLYRRSLGYHWRLHLAVGLAVAVGTAALAGALLVGDSMRGSLRAYAVRGLGATDQALIGNRFFTQQLGQRMTADEAFAELGEMARSIIMINGSVRHADRRTRVDRINLIGADGGFFDLFPDAGESIAPPTERGVLLNEPLARELGAAPGDDLLFHVGRPSAISTETLLGRRDETTVSLRVTVEGIIPLQGAGGFSLSLRHAEPRNAIFPIELLQRALGMDQRVNALLVSAAPDSPLQAEERRRRLQDLLARHARVEDYGLRTLVDPERRFVAMESESLLLPLEVEEAARRAAETIEASTGAMLSYLATDIAVVSRVQAAVRLGAPMEVGAPPGGIPYSTVVAVEAESPLFAHLRGADGVGVNDLAPGEVLLNAWAAADIGAGVGDLVRIRYDIAGPFGRLEQRDTLLTLRGILPMTPTVADSGFVPEYPGVTDTENLAEWDAPFPIDFSRVRPVDEAYWDEHRTAPKAFLHLQDGQRLWATEAERHGRLTAIRIAAEGSDLELLREEWTRALLDRLPPERGGLVFQPIRASAMAAGEGTTDFGMLFLGFSFFLICSAALLTALMFRLGVERRASEVGLLLAVGFSPGGITRWLMIEGLLLAAVGGGVGLLGAWGYAWLMLAGLRSWWSSAVNAPFLALHMTTASLVIGFVCGMALGGLSIRLSMRGLLRIAPRNLLSGVVEPSEAETATKSGAGRPLAAMGLLLLALLLMMASALGWIAEAGGFFGVGAMLLIAAMLLLRWLLHRPPRGLLSRAGTAAWARLGLRNAPRHVSRSLLTAGLIASATFVIAALQAFRVDAHAQSVTDRHGGTGGFALYAEASSPLPYDLGSADGREALDLSESTREPMQQTLVFPFRLRPGDDASCVNLYRPERPRILGATGKFIERGGFSFAASLASTPESRTNPWTLLESSLPDGAIPAIGDESAIRWQFHSNLGETFEIEDERGRKKTLRFVALLKGSALQDELIIGEEAFKQLFPSIDGHAFFLLEAPSAVAEGIGQGLEDELSGFGFDVASTVDRLAGYLAVQNTYLSTFQVLGGLGLILGMGGLAVVMLRNIWERRRELALMRAVGFSRASLAVVVLAENAALVLGGLLAGLVSALVAIAPVLARDVGAVPWGSLSLTLGGVLLAGMLAGAVALRPALRAPLIPSLRAET